MRFGLQGIGMARISVNSFKNSLNALRKRFEEEPPLIEDSARKICFVGDVHGDIETVRYVKKISKKFERVVWLGDFVDRGANDIEVVAAIAASSKSKNVILAGNHDAYKEVEPRDFNLKLKERFGEAWVELDELYLATFKLAPIAYFNTHYRLLAVHGYIPKDEMDWNFSIWKKVKDEEIIYGIDLGTQALQILWNDPVEAALGPRGPGTYIIDTSTTEKFFQQTNIKIIVRSHQPLINKVFNLKNGEIVNIGSSSVYGTRAIFILPEFEFVHF